MTEEKECFFISPIGEDGSDARDRSNKLLEYVIEEAVSDFDYTVTRADRMDAPGSITNQVIQETVESDLVIADLTNHNPNVFYELAVRHATGKPFIQLIDSNQSIPFDISDLRTIQYGLEVEEADQARQDIRSQIEALEEEDPDFDNPISRSAEMQSLEQSDDPTDQNLAEVLQALSRLDRKIENIEDNSNLSRQQAISDFEYEGNDGGWSTIVIDGVEFTFGESEVSPKDLDSLARKTGVPVLEVKKRIQEHPNLTVAN